MIENRCTYCGIKIVFDETARAPTWTQDRDTTYCPCSHDDGHAPMPLPKTVEGLEAWLSS